MAAVFSSRLSRTYLLRCIVNVTFGRMDYQTPLFPRRHSFGIVENQYYAEDQKHEALAPVNGSRSSAGCFPGL
jgi:hypothetical protein